MRSRVETSCSWVRSSSGGTVTSDSVGGFGSRATPSHRDSLACVLSTRTWEPSFHLGLGRPSLRLVLRRGIAYPWDLRAFGRWPGNSWMLTSAATQSVACEHSLRLRDRTAAFSWTLPIEPWPSLRVSPVTERLVRGRTPPRPSTSAARSLRSCAPSSASRASASYRRREAAGSDHRSDPCCVV